MPDLFGTTGADTVVGTELADRIFGGPAVPDLPGAGQHEDSPDLLSGLGGADTLDGSGGDDTLLGGAGNDQLQGGFGNDLVRGGDGTDFLLALAFSSGSGADSLHGEAGDDFLWAPARGGGIVDGGEGWDSLRFTLSFLDGDRVTLVDRTIRDIEVLVTGGDLITATAAQFAGFEDIAGSGVVGLPSVHLVLAAPGLLDLRRQLSSVSPLDGSTLWVGVDLLGSEGGDTLTGGEGRDSILGAAGDDVLDGQGGDDTLEGGAGRDRLLGGEGHDVLLSGDTSGDTLLGGAGDDTLRPMDGADLVDGGEGFDWVSPAGALRSLDGLTLLGIEGLRSGDAFVRASAAIFAGFEKIVPDSNIARLLLTEAGALDLTEALTYRIEDLDFTGLYRAEIQGSGGADSLIGGRGGDTMGGGAGDDVLEGHDGRDFIHGGIGNDRLLGGAGNDVLESGDAAGVPEADSLHGGAGEDVLSSSGGADLLDGGADHDTLSVHADATTLDGFTILDIESLVTNQLRVRAAPGLFQQFESISTTGGDNGASRGIDLALTQGGTLDLRGKLGWTTIAGDPRDREATVVGSDQADRIVTGMGDDSVLGGGGADTIQGMEGDDRILGGSGLDTAVYDALFNDVTVQRHSEVSATGWQVFGALGTDTLLEMEFVQFRNGILDLRTQEFAATGGFAVLPTAADGAEGALLGGVHRFTVTRSGDTTAAASIGWTVEGIGDNAADAADFAGGLLPGGTVAFAAGETSRTIEIRLAPDTLAEADEGYAVRLASIGGLDPEFAIGTIRNDDTNIAIAPRDADRLEGHGEVASFTFQVTRSGETAAAQLLDWAVVTDAADGTDFFGGVLPFGQVSFAAGQTALDITVRVMGDTVLEADEPFQVVLSLPVPGGGTGTGGVVGGEVGGGPGGIDLGGGVIGGETGAISVTLSQASAEGVIRNDDAVLSLAALNAGRTEGQGGSTPFTFTVTREGFTGTSHSVLWSVATLPGSSVDAEDFVIGTLPVGYVLPAGFVTLAPGETSATITVPVRGDSVFEADERFSVDLGLHSAGTVIGTGSANGTIRNDDASVSLTTTEVTAEEGDSGTTEYRFTLARLGASDTEKKIPWSVTGSGANPADAADFVGGALPAGLVTFAANAKTATVTLRVAGDTEVEADEAFLLSLGTAPAGIEYGTTKATGRIGNDDLPRDSVVRIASAAPFVVEGNSGVTALQFNVTRDGDLTRAFSLDWQALGDGAAPVDAADFEAGALPSGTLQFAAGETLVVLTLRVAGDTVHELDEGVGILLGAAPAGVVRDTSFAIAQIRNDDAAPQGPVQERGGPGPDTLEGGALADSLAGGAGDDMLEGGAGDDTLAGGAGNDMLEGGEGNDFLVGGPGADTMAGGAGADRYVVQDGDDVIVLEVPGGGDDRIIAKFSWILTPNTETLMLVGDAADGAGQDLDNRIIGNAGDNHLRGMAGRDTILGHDGDDTLEGGLGYDRLTGGAGNDVFRFLEVEADGRDLLVGFESGRDSIEISAAGFGGGLVAGMDLMAQGRFLVNGNGFADSADGVGQLVYDSARARLWWDADGIGVESRMLVAVLTGDALLARDLSIIG
ncbi:Calx-beta domain-containing protein [Falsiroseomonas selenitidurans]|uniref:Calx-beta domain-containing protein n=1 Tax=Falsiroseomonas selenitidurans TaxID=2716335 RepID=A0ABX1E0F7_9PROT|nr:Calx-beta domain-containing protein [Falsiroseomonas selenitidurans]NKC29247.1 hypothetical protein [Falsiroseomonas selenitidurans]